MEAEKDLLEEMEKAKKLYLEALDKVKNFKQNKLKEKYGNDVTCSDCRYSCAYQVGELANYCSAYGGFSLCDKFVRNNRLSEFVRRLKVDPYCCNDGLDCIASLLGLQSTKELLDCADDSIEVGKAIDILCIVYNIEQNPMECL